jgi:5'-nucleotidase
VTIGYDPSKPAGSRIVSLRLSDGKTLANDATYDIVMNNFMATGGSGLGPPEGSRLEPLSIVDLDALVDYMKKLKSPINAPTEPRIFIAQ